MYRIYADDVCIYNDAFSLDNMKIISPKLTLEDCAAGSLEMTVPPTNLAYDTIVRMVTDISVVKDGAEIWAGRVLSESKDFWNNRILVCEGELAFLNDSTQPPAEYTCSNVQEYLSKLIAIHNTKVASNRQFKIGAVTVHGDDNFPTLYTNYEKTIEYVNALVETYGGHLRVRKVDGIRYLDYLKDCPNTCSQTIQFGTNLIEFTRDWDSSEYATVIVPLGERLDDSPIENLDAYLTIESVNNGSIYLQNDEAVATYGWIEKTVTWDDVSDPETLLEKAKEYLSDLQFDNMEMELNALDMHYLSVDYEAVKLLDEIQVISRPHGLNRYFPVTKLEIPLDEPEKTTFTLGDTVQINLTSANNQTSAAILQKIDDLPKASTLLKEAKANATAIMNMATTGYITIVQDDYGSETLYISNNRDWTQASKLWKWNMNGLGYSNDYGKTFGLAITMDGSIVADYITTGVLTADVIRTGVLKDYNGNFSLDFDTGKLVMKKGSINIGDNFIVYEDGSMLARKGTFAGTLLAADGTFGGTLTVDANGYFSGTLLAADGYFSGTLQAATGSFTGELKAATGSFKGIVTAEDFRDRYGNSMLSGTKIASGYLDLYGLTITKIGTNTTTFKIDNSGNVTMSGNITLAAGSTINWANVSESNLASSDIYGKANDAYNLADEAADDASAAYTQATNAYTQATAAADIAKKIANGTYSGGTFINGTSIYSPQIYSNDLSVIPTTSGVSNGRFSLYAYNSSALKEMLRIEYSLGNLQTVFYGMDCPEALWLFDHVHFSGNVTFSAGTVSFNKTVDFSGATVTGLSQTATFG